jgi:circadian clock protein KaiC
MSVVKKRRGPHEKAIRELSIGPQGIVIGPELDVHHGVFTGVPLPGRGPDDERSRA